MNQPIHIYPASSSPAPANSFKGQASQSPTAATGSEESFAALLSDGNVSQQTDNQTSKATTDTQSRSADAPPGTADGDDGAASTETSFNEPGATSDNTAAAASDAEPASAQASGIIEGALAGNANASSANAQAANMQTAALQSANGQTGTPLAGAGTGVGVSAGIGTGVGTGVEDDIMTPGMMAMAKGLQQVPGQAIAAAQANDNGRKAGQSQSGGAQSGNPLSAGQISGQNLAVTMAGGSAGSAGNNGGGNGSAGNLSQELLAAMTSDGDEAALPGTTATGSAAIFSPAEAVGANSAAPASAVTPGDALDSLNNATANAPGQNIPADRSEQNAPIIVRLSPTLPPPAAQIGVQISRALAEGVNRFNIQMHPADLGRIEVRMEVGHDGKVTALLSADKQDTLDLLQRDSKALERALQESGLKADSNSLSFSLREEQHNPFSTEMADAGDAEAPTDEDLLTDDDAQAHLQQRHDGGVDIRI